MPKKRCIHLLTSASFLRSDYTKVFVFGAFLLWQLPCTGWVRTILQLFTGKMCVQLSLFIFVHFVRFTLRHFSRRFLDYHIELLPNFDSPKHNLRQSFQLLAIIPKCGNGDYIFFPEQTAGKAKKSIPLFTFIRSASRKKSRYA